MKYCINLDLNKNELQNAVIQVLSSAPSNPIKGQIYCDSSDDYIIKEYRIIDGNAGWHPVGVFYVAENNTGHVLTGIHENGTVDTTRIVDLTLKDYVEISDLSNPNDASKNPIKGVVKANQTLQNAFSELDKKIQTIDSYIPSAATINNKLADKQYVIDSIKTMGATYVTSDASGNNFSTVAALNAGPYYYAGSIYTPDNNDYAIVANDEFHSNYQARYIYLVASGVGKWNFQYLLNEGKYTVNNPQLSAEGGAFTWTVPFSDHKIKGLAMIVQVYDVSTGDMVIPDIKIDTDYNVKILISDPSSTGVLNSNTYRVVITG